MLHGKQHHQKLCFCLKSFDLGTNVKLLRDKRLARYAVLLVVLSAASLFLMHRENCTFVVVQLNNTAWELQKTCGLVATFGLFFQRCGLKEAFVHPVQYLSLSCQNLSDENSLAAHLLSLKRSNEQKLRDSASYWTGKPPLLKTDAVINGSVGITHWCGRLGNTMFQIASVIGIAKRNGMVPVLNEMEGRSFLFDGLRFSNVSTNKKSTTTKRCIIREPGVGIYVKETENLSAHCKNYEAVGVYGCLQSWKYFQHVDVDIRRLLTFKSDVYRMAELRVLEGFRSLWKDPRNKNVQATVGVHVRRTDFTSPGWIDIGAVAATDGYFERTMAELESLNKSVVFVVGDDYEYCARLFTKHNMFIVKTSLFPEVDMAVMHMMDKLIISAGTFGWWSAYLGKAKEVYYYKDWPRAGSRLRNELKHEDYFLPHWKGRA